MQESCSSVVSEGKLISMASRCLKIQPDSSEAKIMGRDRLVILSVLSFLNFHIFSDLLLLCFHPYDRWANLSPSLFYSSLTLELGSLGQVFR